ncbi:MAG TPA: PilN domain-containing protein [Phycisphaerae bacterium]|nr:PilN domain-containing protein [Phycisphaerae bacterium]
MNQINLLPEEFIKERFRRRIDLTLVILFAIVMVSVIMAERLSSRKFDAVTQTQTREDGQFAQVDNSSKDFFALLTKRSAYIGDVQKAKALEQKVPRSYLLAVINNACGDELSLEKINCNIFEQVQVQRTGKRVVITSSTANPTKPKEMDIIDIYGVAASDGDVTDFVSRLKSNPVFSEVNLIQTKEWTPMKKPSDQQQKLFEPNRDFSVTLKINPNVDVEELLKKPAAAKPQPPKSAPKSDATKNKGDAK